MAIEIEYFKNGVTLMTESMDYLRSASVGVWVKSGSIFEEARNNGLSHMMEHVAFKGTVRRNTRQLAEEMDRIGGQVNAATSRIYTCYYARALDGSADEALDLLCDLVKNPLLDEQEILKERQVIAEEIGMEEDSPEDLVFENMNKVLYEGQSLSQSILGDKKRVLSYRKEDIQAFRESYYRNDNIVVTCAGSFQREKIRATIERIFENDVLSEQGMSSYPENHVCHGRKSMVVTKPLEQTHICLGFQGYSYGDDRLYALSFLNNILGGGVSSRLFQSVREERGLVYNVYSTLTAYPSCGDFMIYAATAPEKCDRVIGETEKVIRKLLRDGVTDEEIERTRVQLTASHVIDQESSYNRMNTLGSNMMALGRIVPIEETLDKIERISKDEVMAVAKEMLVHDYAMTKVGR